MPSNLELQFHDAMLSVYKRAKNEAHYNARIFIGMVADKGGVETARYLLDTSTVSEGYTALWQRKCLDLKPEAVIREHLGGRADLPRKSATRIVRGPRAMTRNLSILRIPDFPATTEAGEFLLRRLVRGQVGVPLRPPAPGSALSNGRDAAGDLRAP